MHVRTILLVQLALLQAELDGLCSENHRLRSLLSQVNTNYQILNMHLSSLLQKQPNQNPEIPESDHNKVIIILSLSMYSHNLV